MPLKRQPIMIVFFLKKKNYDSVEGKVKDLKKLKKQAVWLAYQLVNLSQKT